MAQSIKAKALKKKLVTQLKKNYPSFNTHNKTEKKAIIANIWKQIYNNYDVSAEPELSKQELLNIEPLPQDIINIEQMKKLMAHKQTNIIPLMPNASIKYIKDPELKDIYDVVDWNLINRLLADKNYTPGKREILPVQFFKAELLKNLKQTIQPYPKDENKRYDCSYEIKYNQQPTLF